MNCKLQLQHQRRVITTRAPLQTFANLSAISSFDHRTSPKNSVMTPLTQTVLGKILFERILSISTSTGRPTQKVIKILF